jgi:hypothetical protein
MDLDEDSDLAVSMGILAEESGCDNPLRGSDEYMKSFLEEMFTLYGTIKLAKMRADYNTLRQAKFRYYRGELSKEELQLLGWTQWQGIKPLKNEMEEFLGGDGDLNTMEVKQQYIQGVVDFLESVMNQIKARDWQIRNAIEWKKFISGA